MEPFEVMTSESQERMLAIVTPEDLDAVLAIAEKWEVRAAVIGTVTGERPPAHPRSLDGEVLADMPAASLERRRAALRPPDAGAGGSRRSPR